MKKVIYLSLLFLPAMLLASGHGAEESRYFIQTGRESDFLPRVINFTIFVSIIYYLLANPIKGFFKARSKGISDQLNEIEERLNLAKKEESEAQQRVVESEARAKEILEDAQNEAVLLAQKIATSSENEIALLEKQLQEKMALEERKSATAVINEILSDNISSEDITLDSTKVIDIISKKVA